MFSGNTHVVRLLALSEPLDQSIEPLHCGLHGETLEVVAATVNDYESTRPVATLADYSRGEWKIIGTSHGNTFYILDRELLCG